MAELFKTVLILSCFGFALTAVLLCIKPVTVKKFPAKWQYYIWITVMLCMIVPIYKLLPEIPVRETKAQLSHEYETIQYIEHLPATDTIRLPVSDNEPADIQKKGIDISAFFRSAMRYLPYIWLAGSVIYLSFAFSSYALYLSRKRKNTFATENSIFEGVRQELGIKRKIPLLVADDIRSPVLVGVFFPKVYIPREELGKEQARMVFLHELTHYKRRDLVLKWFSLFVNAIHWFNPLAYILCRNISDSCEVSCDVAVTRNMTESDRKLYMKTILDFAR